MKQPIATLSSYSGLNSSSSIRGSSQDRGSLSIPLSSYLFFFLRGKREKRAGMPPPPPGREAPAHVVRLWCVHGGTLIHGGTICLPSQQCSVRVRSQETFPHSLRVQYWLLTVVFKYCLLIFFPSWCSLPLASQSACYPRWSSTARLHCSSAKPKSVASKTCARSRPPVQSIAGRWHTSELERKTCVAATKP